MNLKKNTTSAHDSHPVLIRTEELGCVYKSGETPFVALEKITCEVRMGDRIALIGQSGSGKSTLLQILSGIETPTSGHIDWPYFKDQNLMPLRPKGIGLIFQMPNLLPALSVLENVALPLNLSDLPKDQALAQALYELERLGIENLRNKLPEELSGGQAQRVSAARALACKPTLILADEPTGQLDHPTANRLIDVLLKVSKEEGISLLIATHDQAVVKQMDKVWKIEQGSLEV